MDRRLLLLNLVVLLALGAGLARVSAQQSGSGGALSSAFTYQGRLQSGNGPASGSFSMTFRLYDAASGGAELGSQTSVVTVTNGLFTALLDFGTASFDGGARWLELEVDSTTLAPRQQLTATPYALYAGAAPWTGLAGVPADLADGDDVGLTSVQWTDVLTRPAGLDDGDDNTTYTAGSGLTLSGTQFSVNANTTQARVTGSCPLGSSVRAIAANGTVTCTIAEPRPKFTSSHTAQPDDTGTIMALDKAGQNPMATIGADGLPIIAFRYQDDAWSTNGSGGIETITRYNLRVAHCNDLACASATVTQIDGGGAVGNTFGIAIGYDGLAVISYFDQGSLDLKLAHCDNLECTASTISTLESGRQSGAHNAVTINGNSNPIISYYDQTDTSLKVALCGNFSCTTAVTATVHDLNDTGKFTSIALGVDGLPIISYYNQSEGSLWAAHCNNADCTNVTASRLDDVNDTGHFTSVALGADGLAVISYHDATTDDLKLAHCSDIACTGAAIVTVDSAGFTGFNTSLAIGADGLPLIAYFDDGVDDLRVAHCQTVTCGSAVRVSTDSAGSSGHTPSITIGSDGLPLVAYHYAGGKVLKVIHCGNLFCTPFARAR